MPQRYKVVVETVGPPGKRGKVFTHEIEATPREIAKKAASLIARAEGTNKAVRVFSSSNQEVMVCTARIFRQGERAKAKRGVTNDRTIARCDIAFGFKQLLRKPKRRPVKR